MILNNREKSRKGVAWKWIPVRQSTPGNGSRKPVVPGMLRTRYRCGCVGVSVGGGPSVGVSEGVNRPIKDPLVGR